jgi:hypothetical protein
MSASAVVTSAGLASNATYAPEGDTLCSELDADLDTVARLPRQRAPDQQLVVGHAIEIAGVEQRVATDSTPSAGP